MPSCRSASRMTLSVRAVVAPAVKRLRGRLDCRSMPDFREETSHAYHAVSPRFPGQPVGSGCRRCPRPGRRSPTRGRRKSPRYGSAMIQYLRGPQLPRRGPAARRRDSPTSATCPIAGRRRSWRLRLRLQFRSRASPVLDAGEPITVLAGLHSGCYELFAQEPIRTISELKGKRVGIPRLKSGRHLYPEGRGSLRGLDPDADINWVASPDVKPAELFEAGKIDAFLGFPPEPQELRARKIGRVILNTATDKPWSQYYCCMRRQQGLRP